MGFFRKHQALTEAAICSFALMLFSFFIQSGFPVKLISFTSLLLAAWLIGKNLVSDEDIRKITGNLPSLKNFFLYLIIGISGGLALAIFYRWYLDASLMPRSVTWFAFVAALIGCMEELVFRGYLQDSVKNAGTSFSIIFGTMSHTGYKCCLFLSPMAIMKVDIGFLAFWTIIAGLIYGTIRHYSKSIIPSLVGHALFDIWVYAEFIKAPWWVW
jgi:membrane protease YdiL (CAAX protease family)